MQLGLSTRWQRRAMVGALAVLLLAALSGAVLPSWVQWQLEKRGPQMLGRMVTVEQVVFRPWSLSLLLRGLRVGHADATDTAGPAQLTVDEVEVNPALLSLVYGAPVADALVLRQPQLQLTHSGQGRYDIDDLLRRWATPSEPSSGMPRLSLHNIQIVGGGVRFHDAPRALTHVLSDVQLDIPFLSTLAIQRDVLTHPRLAFKLNGAAFDSDARSTPFAEDRHTQAHFKLQNLDFAPYLPYWPAVWPVRLAQGQLDMDIAVDFRQRASAQMTVSGHAAVTDLKLLEKTADQADLPLLQWHGLEVQIDAWRPLDSVLELDAVRWDRPQLHVRRGLDGRLNWVRVSHWLAQVSGSAPAAAKSSAVYGVKHLQLLAGQVHWHDAMTRVPAHLALTDLDFQSRDGRWPAQQMASFSGQARLAGATLNWRGETDFQRGQLGLSWAGLPLQAAAPYVAEWLLPELSGQTAAKLTLDWRAAQGAVPARWVITAPQIRLTDARLGKPEQPDVALAELALDQLEVDLLAHKVRVGRVALTRPELTVSRNAQGRWMVQDGWMTRPAQVEKFGAQAGGEMGVKPHVEAATWQLDVHQSQIRAGGLRLDDRAPDRPVQMDVREVNLSAGRWQTQSESPVWTAVQGSWLAGSARREAGRLAWDGQFRLPSVAKASAQAAPFQLKGRLALTRFPVHQLGPYLSDWLNIDLKRADLSYDGTLDGALPDAGPDLDLQGRVALENLRATLPADSEELLNVKSLNVLGVDLGVRSGALARLNIADTTLSDFVARVAIDPRGQINWRHLFKAAPAHAAPATPSQAQIQVGPTSLLNGSVLFSDHHIEPHYVAELTDLAGSLGAFSNRQDGDPATARAELRLRGRMAGSGKLDIHGQLNPLTQPVLLDVHGQVSDLELPPLSAYSHKYAGYGIERGKFSAQVDYRIDAQAQLHASHQIVLNQLRFGEKSHSAEAPSLPIKLAAALLANSQGVIDINLPVSGSLDDPDFRVGDIVGQMVLNLIGKAILSPLSLISGVFSGQEHLEQVAFALGSAELDAANRQKLQSLAQSLGDKPALRVTLVGQVDAAAEREAFRHAELADAIRAEKRRRLQRDNPDTAQAGVIAPQEYPALLQSVYRRSPMPKPRNALGLLKELSVSDMETMLLAAVPVDESAMRELAQARAEQVREALIALKVPETQLFLGAPEVLQSGRAAAFVPQVKLMMSTD